jgi:hypothetical protein
MAGSTTKIDKAWEQLFTKHDILMRVSADGEFRISSSQINEFHEARLMAKFDQSAQLPDIFRTNRLSILPTTRGNYIIGPFVTHEKISYRTAVKPQQVETLRLETLDEKDLYSDLVYF